jgi:estrogen-related receptor beta like 1
LATKSDDIETLKAQMADRNQSMTDTSPLRLIKTALVNLQKEVKQMELRIGVASQSLLQVRCVRFCATHGGVGWWNC